jgi:penicillin amidase
VKLTFSDHGPVLWEDVATHRALALRWSGAEPGTAGYLASLSLDRAKDWDTFLAAMQRWKLPPENMVYADNAGNIGEQSAGLVPIRENWNGLLPVLADGNHEWHGFFPLAKLPRFYNPAEGFIATANHKIIKDDQSPPIGFEWSPFRIQRINEVLRDTSPKRKITMDDMTGLQNDVVSLPARTLVSYLRELVGPRTRAESLMLDDLTPFLLRSTPQAVLYEFWRPRIEQEVARRVDGTDAKLSESLSEKSVMEMLAKAGASGASLSRHDRDEILRETLNDAFDEATKKLGPEIATWHWSDLHVAHFRHPLEALRPDFDLGPVPRPGDGDTVNSTYGDQDFLQTGGASFREVIDLSDWDKSVTINVPGQSGRPGTAHYSDLLPLWTEGKYFPLLYSREKIEKAAEQKLELLP